METRTLRNYFDASALDETFGSDRVDRYWEETQGLGALHRGPDGEFYHKPHGTDEPRRATDDVIEAIVGGEESDDVV